MTNTIITRLQSNKSALEETRIVEASAPELRPGEALLRIGRLAITSNNVTYAAFGDVDHLRYWSFFPTGDDSWGHMPAWGFADVLQSTVPGLEPGERFYGYWPIVSQLVVQPVRVGERGFYDGMAHRQVLTSAYNQYQRVRTDAAYRREHESYQALLRPLFLTSFMLADFLEDNAFFGAKQVVLSSASSKTAYGTAFCLEGQRSIELIALTSASNVGFVQGLGCYRRTFSYEALQPLSSSTPTLYIDFAGSAELRRRVHEHFGTSLVYSCYAGSAQSHDHINKDQQSLPGPKPEPYFAPYQIKKRNADWGPAEVTRRFNDAQFDFIERVSEPTRPWMVVKEHQGFPAAQQLVRDIVSGRIDPKEGHVVVLA
jgi:hypothetical protein